MSLCPKVALETHYKTWEGVQPLACVAMLTAHGTAFQNHQNLGSLSGGFSYF